MTYLAQSLSVWSETHPSLPPIPFAYRVHLCTSLFWARLLRMVVYSLHPAHCVRSYIHPAYCVPKTTKLGVFFSIWSKIWQKHILLKKYMDHFFNVLFSTTFKQFWTLTWHIWQFLNSKESIVHCLGVVKSSMLTFLVESYWQSIFNTKMLCVSKDGYSCIMHGSTIFNLCPH